MCKLSSIQNELKRQMVLAGLKAGVPHLAMTKAEEYDLAPSKPEKDTYICYAISNGRRAGLCERHESNAAMDLIAARLNGHTTAEEYLRNGLKINEKLLSVRNVQQYRKRWLDALIKEFS